MVDKTNIQLASDLRTVLTRLIKRLRSESSPKDILSLTERSTLSLIDQHKELSPSELAAMEKITTQSMSQILNHLSDLGFIDRTPSATDKRKMIITLSKRGHELINKARNERDEWLNKALQQTCSVKELEILKQAIMPLTKLVEYE